MSAADNSGTRNSGTVYSNLGTVYYLSSNSILSPNYCIPSPNYWSPNYAFLNNILSPICDSRGEAAVGFAILLPILLALSFAILEFSIATFDFHRAGEAARRAARLAAVGATVTELSALQPGQTVACTALGGTVSCAGGAGSQAAFDAILGAARAMLPTIGAENLSITYANSGIGDPATPGGILPLVTVRLVGVQHQFLLLRAVPGLGTGFAYPPFTSNYLAGGQGPAPS